jgi:agmatine deiminase
MSLMSHHLHVDCRAVALTSDLSYRLPAEWEPHAATWLIWPGNDILVQHWRGQAEALRCFVRSYIEQLVHSEPVCLLVAGSMRHRPPEAWRSDPRIHVIDIASNDVWLRDTAPTFLVPQRAEPASAPVPIRALCARWAAYGGKYYPSDQDAALAVRIASHLHCLREDLPLVLEGGAFDTDGQGTVLLSTGSVVCPQRHPGQSQQSLESRIREALGASHLIWVTGCLEGDDTDGHVDQMVRFVAPGRVLVANQPDPGHPDHAMLLRLQEQLQHQRDARGRKLEIIPINLPPARYIGSRLLPSSYLNFYITNRAVYIPCFGSSSDDAAVLVLEGCFPGRRIVPIDCRVLIHGGGALHCISRQQPALAEVQQPYHKLAPLDS